jgi:tetratricopeptide (TPR) repeat protein
VGDSGDIELILILAAAALEDDPSRTIALAKQVLEQDPKHAEAALLQAAALSKQGNHAQAESVLAPLIQAHTVNSAIQLEYAVILSALGHFAQAEQMLKTLIEQDATLSRSFRELAKLYYRQNQVTDGDRAFNRYLELEPVRFEHQEIASLIADHRLDRAEQMAQALLKKRPDDHQALKYLGEVSHGFNDYQKAEAYLAHSLSIEPGYSPARFELSLVLAAQQKSDAALTQLARLLVADPFNKQYRMQQAQVLRLNDEHAAALEIVKKLLEEDTADVKLTILAGHLQREVGDSQNAKKAYQAAIALDPLSGDAWWSLANLKTAKFTPQDQQALEQAIAKASAVSENRIRLEFAMGKLLEDAGDYENSFAHYANANSLHRGRIDYSADAVSEEFRRLEDAITPKFFHERKNYGLTERDPIFVVGIPRSGSTLIEQILASHPLVEGTRELPYIPHVVQQMGDAARRQGAHSYVDNIHALSAQDIEQMARTYLANTARHRAQASPYFVDKMLSNFIHIGLIHLMFPNAIIIDARRHPMGTGFSCFKQLFARGMLFSYHLTEIAQYYQNYVELMALLDSVLPQRVYRVHYEAMVASPEAEVRKLLDHCQLPFDERCLRFYDTNRTVMTISSEQVRQPIYSQSSEQWKHFEPWLQPLREPLDDIIKRYPHP